MPPEFIYKKSPIFGYFISVRTAGFPAKKYFLRQNDSVNFLVCQGKMTFPKRLGPEEDPG